MIKLSVVFILTVLSLVVVVYPQSAPPKPKQESDQSIQLQAELIQIHAVVTDKQGQVIRDLKKDDFEIFENKKKQEISFFSTDNVGSVNGSAPGTKTGADRALPGGGASANSRRTVVLYVDNLHLSATSLIQTRLMLHKFVDEQLSGDDAVAIVTSNGSLGLLEQFTSDRRILHFAINKLSFGMTSPETLFTPYLAARIQQGDEAALDLGIEIIRVEDFDNDRREIMAMLARAKAGQIINETSYLRRTSLYGLKAVAERLTEMPGQRIIAVLSDGFSLYASGGSPDRVDLDSTISRAVRSGVVIYTIDAKGLLPVPGIGASSRGVKAEYEGYLLGSMIAAEQESRAGLTALAKDTGGEFLHNNNDIGGLLKRALDENQFYYTMAYYPAGNEKSKDFRSISIKVKNHPEYHVRTQNGYSPEDILKAKMNEAKTPVGKLFQAIAAPLPKTQIGVVATASFYGRERDPSQVIFNAHIDGNNIEYKKGDKRDHFYLELVTVIYDVRGKPVDQINDKIEGDLLPEHLALGKKGGYNYSKSLSLKPGLYQVRIGVQEPTTGKIGTGIAWVEVPTVNGKKLAISGIVLGEQSSGSSNAKGNAASPPAPVSEIRQGIRFYKSGQPLVFDVRLYSGAIQASGENGLMMQAEILLEGTSVKQSSWAPVNANVIGKDKIGLDVRGQVNLDLRPGIYELRLQFRDSKMKVPIQQTTFFGVDD